jgi:hypothetical protein
MVARWKMLVLNLIAAVVFLFLAVYFAAIHRAHAYSTYRYFVINHALVEGKKSSDGKAVDIERSMRRIGGVDIYYTIFGVLAAAACVTNGLIFFRRHSRPSDTI